MTNDSTVNPILQRSNHINSSPGLETTYMTQSGEEKHAAIIGMAIIRKRSGAQGRAQARRNIRRIGVRSVKTRDKRPLTAQIRAYTRRTKRPRARGPESQLYTRVCPAIYIFRVFGLAPFEFDEDELVPSEINTIYSFVWLCIYGVCMYCVLANFTYVDRDNRVALQITELYKTVFNCIVVIIDLVFVVNTRGRMAKIWNQIQTYDEVICDLGYARSERNSALWVWGMLLFWGILYTLINQIGMYAFAETWFRNMAYMILYVGTCLSVLKFSSIVMMLAGRFTDLAAIVEKNAPLAQKWMTLVAPVDVRVVEHLYDDLMVICESLSDLYSWIVMLWLGNLCIHSVSGLYFIISWLLDDEQIYRADFICLNVWNLTFIAQLFILHYSCHLASSKVRLGSVSSHSYWHFQLLCTISSLGNRMNYIILGWKRWLYTRQHRNRAVKPSLHIANRPLGIDAAGCFDVNLQLLCSIVGMQTTYLVLLLQIG